METMTVESGPAEPFGWSARIDLYQCDESTLVSRDRIQLFLSTLCDDILGMKRYGEPLIEWFGGHEEKAAWFSFVQLIETSSVIGHISEARRSVYLDIFSCRPFDAASAARHAMSCFGADSERTATDVRQ